MTVIAWDGKTLAADKLATSGGLMRTVTKIFKLNDGSLFAGCGDFAFCLQMKDWIERGASLDNFPSSQRHEQDWQTCIVIDRSTLHIYERTPFPIIFEDTLYACGSGRDFAHTAMYLGKTAKEAVELACLLDCQCGNGVDVLTLD